jgi:hypothetical protein
MAANCGTCGAKRNALVHSRGECTYVDASKAGMSAIGKAREAYQKSEAHKRAYEGVSERSECAFEAAGAPDPCHGGITPHHTFPVGRAGSRERAERVAPVVPACSWHNTWVSQDAAGIEWGETHWVTVGGRDWPLLISDAQALALEEAGRTFGRGVEV